MSIKELYRQAARKVAGASAHNTASIEILRSGAMSIDRSFLHKSASFKRQIDALRKIERELEKKRR